MSHVQQFSRKRCSLEFTYAVHIAKTAEVHIARSFWGGPFLASYLQFPIAGILTNILMIPSRTYISIIWGVALLIAMAGPMD